jgi:hypothetical protein
MLYACMKSITAERLYANERGYQGQLLAEVNKRIGALALTPHAILEQEHQKVISMCGIARSVQKFFRATV